MTAVHNIFEQYEQPETNRRFELEQPSEPHPGRRIHEEFQFVLDRELIDPETNRGHVTSISAPEEISFQGKQVGTVQEIRVWDPYVAADPETYNHVTDYITNVIEARMEREGFDITTSRQEARNRDEWNRYTKAWLGHNAVQALSLWRELVPNAMALYYLTNPNVGGIIASPSGETAKVTKETAAQWRFVADAITVRGRGVAMAYLAGEHIASMPGDEPIQVLSQASGTAEPMIMAAVEAQQLTSRQAELTVADIDRNALAMVGRIATNAGFQGKLNPVTANILADNLRDRLAQKTGRSPEEVGYDIVEQDGFTEYLPEADDELMAFRGKNLIPASEFLRRSFEYVKPGGININGNMILNRQQSKFVFGAVDWPLINARSEDQILRIYDRAGILNNPKAQFKMYRIVDDLTGLHVYNMMLTKKLA